MGYLCFISAKKDSVVLQPGETVEYLWADKEEFIKYLQFQKHYSINTVESYQRSLNEFIGFLKSESISHFNVPPLRKRLRETVGRLFGENAAE